MQSVMRYVEAANPFGKRRIKHALAASVASDHLELPRAVVTRLASHKA